MVLPNVVDVRSPLAPKGAAEATERCDETSGNSGGGVIAVDRGWSRTGIAADAMGLSG